MPTTTPELTTLDREILTFERMYTHWAYEGHREQAIRTRFDMSREVYALRLVRLIRRPEAWAFDGVTCARLQRVVESRRV